VVSATWAASSWGCPFSGYGASRRTGSPRARDPPASSIYRDASYEIHPASDWFGLLGAECAAIHPRRRRVSGRPEGPISPRHWFPTRNLPQPGAAPGGIPVELYDFYLTAQLATDGIKDTKMPRWISSPPATGHAQPAGARARPGSQHHHAVGISGPPFRIQLEVGGGEAALEIDRVDVIAGGGGGRGASQAVTGGNLVVSGSDDGREWHELGHAARPPGAPGNAPVMVRLAARRTTACTVWPMKRQRNAVGVSELAFLQGGRPRRDWRPVRLHLGVEAGRRRDRVDVRGSGRGLHVRPRGARLDPRAAEGSIQVSGDAKSWRTLAALPTSGGAVDEIKLTQPARGRYVRVLLNKPATRMGTS